MTVHYAVESYLTDTVTLLPDPGRAANGKRNTALPEVSLKARVVAKRHMVTNRAGNNVISTCRLLLVPRTVSMEDRFRVSGELREVAAVALVRDFASQTTQVDLF